MGIFSPMAQAKPYMSQDAPSDVAVYPPKKRNKFMITYHPWYHQFDMVMVDKALRAAYELGASTIRFDIRWKDLLPDWENTDEETIAWYRWFIDRAVHVYGLQVYIVLSNAPQKPKERYKRTFAYAKESWRKYVSCVRDNFAKECTYIQLLNEFNGWIFTPFTDAQSYDLILQGGDILKAQYPDVYIVSNVVIGWPQWDKSLRLLIKETHRVLDIVGIDYYPGTYNLINRVQWKKLPRLVSLATQRYAPHKNISLAITETGTPADGGLIYKIFQKSERLQEKYYKILDNVLQTKIPYEDLALFGVYELSDADSHDKKNYECHFGLLSSDLKRYTPAYQIFKKMIETYTR